MNERKPRVGDIYKITQTFWTLAHRRYAYGDLLELIRPTELSPFGHKSEDGNWIVRCKNFQPPDDRSVWSMIQWLIANDHVVLVK